MGNNILFKASISLAVIVIALSVYFLGANAIVLVACLVFLIAAMAKKDYLLMFLVMFFSVFPKVNLISVSGTGTSIRIEDFVAAFVILFVALMALKNNKGFAAKHVTKLIFLFIGVSFVSYVLGMSQRTIEPSLVAFLYLFRRLEYLSFFFIGYFIASKGSAKVVKNASILSIVIIAIFAVLQKLEIIGGFYQGNYISSAAGGRLLSTFGNPPELAAFVAIMFTFAALGFIEERNKLFWLALGLIEVYLLFASGTRIVFISIPVGLVVLALFKKKVKFIIIPLLIVSMFIMADQAQFIISRFDVLLKPETINFIKDTFTDRGYTATEKMISPEQIFFLDIDYSSLTRAYIWASAYKMFLNYPVFGSGQSAFGDFVDNNYVRMLAENGIIGFIVFLLLIRNIWKSCVRIYNDGTTQREIKNYALFILIMITNMMVMAFTVDIFESARTAIIFWLFVGVFFKLAAAEKENMLSSGIIRA